MKCPIFKELPLPPKGRLGWPWTDDNALFIEFDGERDRYPKVSVVTPTYNQSEFIEETIRSVLLQGYPDLEYIIIDGGSTDGTREIIKKYEPWLAYRESRKDEGQSDAINRGFTKATGEVLAWLNSDDLYMPGAIQKAMSYWAEKKTCFFLTGDGEYFDDKTKQMVYGVKCGKYTLKDLMCYFTDKYLPQPSVFFSKNLFESAGRCDTNLRYSMDLDLWIRMRLKEELHHCPIVMSRARMHAGSKTCAESEQFAIEVIETLEKYMHFVPLISKARIRAAYRSKLAAIICDKGLEEYFNKNKAEAWSSLRRAGTMNWLILFSRKGLRLFLRLILGDALKKLIFKR